jgi:phospholipid/cholesterol/gamma-HCH transport system permease protein
MLLLYPIKQLGRQTLYIVRELGKMGIFISRSFFYFFFPPYLLDRIIKQVNFIGVKTIAVILLTGTFTGMVLTLQSYYVLVHFGAESKLGSITALSLIRELGPVVTALMVIGRAGSALTAEIGIMRMSEQIDALDAMNLNPYKYLIIPNILAAVLALPVLTSFFNVVGIWGGYLVGVKLSGLSDGIYYGAIADSIRAQDLFLCLNKSLSFGFLIGWICCYKGFFAGAGSGFGAQGVSKATTDAVVLSSIVILICDYYITSISLFG